MSKRPTATMIQDDEDRRQAARSWAGTQNIQLKNIEQDGKTSLWQDVKSYLPLQYQRMLMHQGDAGLNQQGQPPFVESADEAYKQAAERAKRIYDEGHGGSATPSGTPVPTFQSLLKYGR